MSHLDNEKIQERTNMKAVILAAGMGSRIRPLTDNCPKSLLKIGGHTILEMMISHIRDCGITDIVFVLGYLQEQIKEYVTHNFPELNAHFIFNEQYATTNTGFSLMLARDLAADSSFIKFDADVLFDKTILRQLIDCEHDNALCIDKNIQLDAEEIKVIVKEQNRVVKASKTVNPKEAIGESIGIEKICADTAIQLFTELEAMMQDSQNHQEYYEAAYERLIEKDVPFYALDISGLKWIEIDTKEDFVTAKEIFT
ncbi:MAG: choline kinase [Candidatus Azotimanducaceae bacterium]|jgi:choline kinase